jgi:16S rRNA processing protein RimM
LKSSNSPEPPKDFVLIGKIAGVHGIRGNLKVVSYADSPDVFETDRPFLVIDARGASHSHTIDWVRPHQRGLVMAFHDIQDRDGAETLLQAQIYIKRSDLPELEESTYYWFELIGLAVTSSNGEFLGRIDSVMETGSNDVYVVKDEDRGTSYEVLVPAMGTVVRSVDLERGVMTVELPEGL